MKTKDISARLWLACVALWYVVLVLAGCHGTPARAKLSIDKGRPRVEQSGPVKAPAKATVETTATALPIPAGSTVFFDLRADKGQGGAVPPPSPVRVQLSAATELRSESRRESISGPAAFDPPSPPSPVEIAQASGIRWFYLAGVASGVLAVIAFATGYKRAALYLGAGAVGMPALGRFFSSEAAMRALCVVGAGAFSLWWAWHVLKPKPAAPA